MFDSILVPLDGSELAECTLPHAIAVARSFDAEMTLLRMLENNQSGAFTEMFDPLNWQINKTQATLYLEKRRIQCQEAGLRTRAAVLEGLVAEGITEYAHSQGMKLIILSSHGQGGLTQWGISSVTQKIILSAPTSILIVRARQQAYTAIPPYQRILVPLDGSQRAENVLPIVTQMGQIHQSEIHFVQVVQTPDMVRQMPPVYEDIVLSDRIVARNRAEGVRYLEEVQARSCLKGVTIQTHLMTSDNPAMELHRIVEQEKIDMVTLSAHGYSGNHQWPYGNIVNNFILYSKVPLLIVQDYPARQENASLMFPFREHVER